MNMADPVLRSVSVNVEPFSLEVFYESTREQRPTYHSAGEPGYFQAVRVMFDDIDITPALEKRGLMPWIAQCAQEALEE
jgi:hypothetical protein